MREKIVFLFLITIKIFLYSVITYWLIRLTVPYDFGFLVHYIFFGIGLFLGTLFYLWIHYKIFIGLKRTKITKVAEILSCGIIILPISAILASLLDSIYATWFLLLVFMTGGWLGQITLEAIIEVVEEAEEECDIRIVIKDYSNREE
ncbi:hypothetical protein BCJMU51_5475 [Bacillus cereus]|uniref:hypothetical protein n=1 Tax=Bacillus cereus TaxID=1396 RepID=UPI001F2ECD92|nr:hypothetical protein [Bacillus cereus]BCB40557.1 hypothetical protein BCM0045_5452 [Bacillus cereus]BCC03393.1 hypothetical protein BCM0057_5475 [Bacillus cereus]BCC26912.1 hypothetical protein BCM0079_5505 [Bacillus cereus]BCC38472.1 hypothetical protein BCM0105_5462 [Bacillus cereus]BCC44270.1 hypothetical protein BCJMU01_5437 [Bacillus cereus]